MELNEEAQIHTLEGFFAASMMIFTVMIIIKSTLIITPQSELTMDVQLEQIAEGVLSVLDIAPETAFQFDLTKLVAGWNMTEATPQGNSLLVLDTEIGKQLKDIIYNIDFAYDENGSLTVKHAILHGAPIENSVVATRLVTLYNSTVTQAGGAWNISSNEVKVVEVRLVAWQV